MNFRRWITALAVLALFAGFASAQVAVSTAGTGSFQCQASVAVPPTIRAEGLTELIGDIVLNCSGGVTPILGSVLPTANVTVSLGANVTSRLLSYAQVTPSAVTAANTSEALLLIDEPGSGLTMGAYGAVAGGPSGPVANFGPAAAQTLCGASGTPYSAVGAGPGGCVEYAQQLGAPSFDYVMSSTASTTIAPVAGANVFAGVSSGNQVTFYGIPIMPPASAGVARIFRITNVRLNANALAGGGLPGTQSVQASIAISSNSSVLVNSPTPIVGFIQPGLSSSTSLRNTSNTGSGSAPNFAQCSNASVGTTPNLAILRFVENFGTAFKTRVSPTATTSGQATTAQNVPGTIYNSESGFILSTLNSTNTTLSATAGLADFGTRLKAVFNNIPTGVRIFVSTTNVVNLTGTVPALLTVPAGNSTTSFAQLVMSETATDGSGYVPTVPATGYNYAAAPGTTQLNGYAELAQQNNSATAVWEVINANSARYSADSVAFCSDMK